MQAIMCAQSLQGRGTCVQVLHTQFSLYATLSLGRLVYLLSNSYVSTICYATEPRLSARAPRGKDPVFQGGHSPSEKSCLRQGWAIIFDRGPLTFLKQVRVTPEGAGPKQEVGAWGGRSPLAPPSHQAPLPWKRLGTFLHPQPIRAWGAQEFSSCPARLT